jgi:hypothetical protein
LERKLSVRARLDHVKRWLADRKPDVVLLHRWIPFPPVLRALSSGSFCRPYLRIGAASFESSRHSPISRPSKGQKEGMFTIINQITLVGFLGRDALKKALPSRTPVLNFSLATKKVWKDGHNEWQERTQWHRVVFMWN